VPSPEEIRPAGDDVVDDGSLDDSHRNCPSGLQQTGDLDMSSTAATIIIRGRLGSDPEMRYTKDGQAVICSVTAK
jgi:hypothetical protein